MKYHGKSIFDKIDSIKNKANTVWIQSIFETVFKRI